ncbi:hypothetical protein Aph01nite_71090 [Acrocarpospora phusangensis]|uniref:Uncharacterized protein n=1 Tax=Acrocarpospora phusangensis TaxID=1070424 RepID=A0A919QGS4_9ACTN|nr:DUF6220 domain-containing protein [Acrocarpospora phusangensis]GIH28799.1 hypothetical protein Aph01nite_71090 [Acrocarpospora phusangensis]
MRKVFFWFSVLLLVSVLAQFYLATFGAFERPAPALGAMDSAIVPHIINGTMVIPVLSLLLTVFAAIAKAGRQLIWLSIAPFGLVAVQLFVIFELAGLAGATENSTTTAGLAVLGFHALDGVAILWVTVTIVRKARALLKTQAAEPVAAHA